MKKNQILFLTAIYSFVLLSAFTSCKEPESTRPENRTDSLMLKVKETDLTTATLSLHTAGITYPASLTLTRNSQPVQTFSLHRPDTTLIDTALTPSTTYTWQAIWKKTETTFLKGETVTGKTMDSTSHDFTWRLDTLGAPGSILWDVAIVNDTCVWVVGDIVSDPANHPIGRYNAAMWNGKVWKKYRISMLNGVGTLSVQILNTLFHVNSKLFLSSGSSLTTMDILGNVTKREYYRAFNLGATKKIFGRSATDLFLVGDFGSITHYNGSTFTLMESGTTVDLLDVWGTSESDIWSCGSVAGGSISLIGHSVLLHLEKGSWKTINEEDFPEDFPVNSQPTFLFRSVWQYSSSTPLFQTSAFGVFSYNQHKSIWSWDFHRQRKYWLSYPPPEMGMPVRIRGTSPANVMIGGDHLSLLHFNGSTWKQLTEVLEDQTRLKSLDISKTRVVAVGEDPRSKAFILTGKQTVQTRSRNK
ncbi:MAG: hypothetical protein LCH54_17720 [Bacteroidetes bacterium]|nr:hypothetical protein [Bacteroidota bacterium]